MFRKQRPSTTVKVEILPETSPVADVRDLPAAELAGVGGALRKGGGWNPSWTAPQDPDDIFRDDG